MATHCHNSPILPGETLLEIRDMLTLALDVSERRRGYTQPEREARSYVRAALRRAERLTGARA